MKIQNISKAGNVAAAQSAHKAIYGQTGGSKTTAHRHERRKYREQLRRMDWASLAAD
jgi:hypothetical protein